MMAECGLSLAHTTNLRWVKRYTPEFVKRWNRLATTASQSAGRRDLREDSRQMGLSLPRC